MECSGVQKHLQEEADFVTALDTSASKWSAATHAAEEHTEGRGKQIEGTKATSLLDRPTDDSEPNLINASNELDLENNMRGLSQRECGCTSD